MVELLNVTEQLHPFFHALGHAFILYLNFQFQFQFHLIRP